MRSPIHPARFASLALVALAAACSSSPTDNDVEPQVIEDLTFAASLDIDLAEYTLVESTGIYVKDLVEGTGVQAQTQSLVEVDYKAWLADGTLIYQGIRQWQFGNFDQPLGMEYGILFLQEGAVRRMIVPPALGWGLTGSSDGRVPPGAVVIFEVELLEAI